MKAYGAENVGAFVPPDGFTADSLFHLSARPSAPVRRAKARAWRTTSFAKQSHHYRRGATVSLGWRIRTDPNGRGIFTTHDILPGSREWGEAPASSHCQWADALFLKTGQQPAMFFNATIRTLALVWAEGIIAAAEDAIDAAISTDDANEARLRSFSRRLPGGGCEMIFAPAKRLASLGGLTREGAIAGWLREHWETRGDIFVPRQSAKLCREYGYGVGLNLVTGERALSLDGVVAAIACFRSYGEQDYILSKEPFGNYAETVDAILRGHLCQWDCVQADADDEPRPEWPEDAVSVDSNLIRI